MARRIDVLDRVETKIDMLSEKLEEINITTVRQQAILEEHQRRSVANEEAVKLLRSELKPLQDHASMVKGASKLITLTGVLAGLAAALFKLFGA